jgi:hypothetical protein
MAKRKVFVSFDYDHDKQYKYMLEAWDANPQFDFSFADQTPGEIDTSNIGRIKAGLTAKINQSTYTLVIIGQYANTPHPKRTLIGYKNWINFEIAQSKANRNKIVGIKIDRTNESPDEILNANASWAMAFTQDAILRALNSA